VIATSRARDHDTTRGAYNDRMPPDFIRYQGRNRYSNASALDRAIVAARDNDDDDDGSLRFFIKESASSVRVDVFVPAVSELQYTASHVFQALARDALDGAVYATCHSRAVDVFPYGDDD
jgi:hypothetical protein